MPIHTLTVETQATRWFRRLAIFLVAWGGLLIVLGGLVTATGSGLSCPAWPLCGTAGLLPPTGGAWLAYSHRLAVLLSALGSGALFLIATRNRRDLHRWTLPVLSAVLASFLLQAAFGALLVAWQVPALLVWMHTVLSVLLFGLLVANAALVWPGSYRFGGVLARVVALRDDVDGLGGWLAVAALAAFGLVLSGAYVTQSGAALACPGFPQCGESSAVQGLQTIQMVHRGASYVVFVFFLWLVWRYTAPLAQDVSGLRAWNWTMVALFVAAGGAGVVNVLWRLPLWSQVTHLTLAAAVWGGFVFLLAVYRAGRQADILPAAARPSTSHLERRFGSRLFTYFWLTKPYITVLLLVTTLGAMLIAGPSLPPLSLVLWTLLGGALSASSANTLNAYLERDLDNRMARTRRRPLPTARVEPRRALILGFALGILSLVILGVFANLLSAALSAVAIFYYVVIYTMWLKPRTPHNIVIGGAAGALPPMIGWTAVTGRIDLMALFLFAIIFYWTPPHTWALTLLVQKDYAQVNIPMWPVARGEADTRTKILLYTLLMLSITIAPAGLRLLGPIYLLASVLLGGIFLALSVRLYRVATKASAMSLYKFSTLYLALLFAAMVIDKIVV